MSPIARYTIGAPQKPAISHDNGFLALGTRQPTMKDKVAYVAWNGVREALEAVQGVPLMPKNDISDALAAYKHFLDGTGAKRKISVERFVKNDSSGQRWLEGCLREAQAAIYSLSASVASSVTTFQFYGTALSVGLNSADFPYPQTENWQKTIGAFPFWITGDVTITRQTLNDAFDATVEFHIEDKYNFNPTQQDIASGIPDSWNGAFSRTGLAQPYINYGSVTRNISWVGKPSGTNMPDVDSSGRESRRGGRQPDNNRRLRNRV